MATEITLVVPDSALAALRKDPQECGEELRLTAAAKWYELGVVSQERAAEIAGLSRAEFLRALARLKVSPFQYAIDEVREDLRGAD